MDAAVDKIIELASTKLSLGDDLVLCEVKSNGGTLRLVVYQTAAIAKQLAPGRRCTRFGLSFDE